MEINRKTKLRFPAPGGRKLPLPDLGTTGYIRKHFPGVRLPAPPQSAVPMLRSGRNRSRVPAGVGAGRGPRGVHRGSVAGPVAIFPSFYPHRSYQVELGLSHKTFPGSGAISSLGYVQVIKHTFYAVVGT